MPITLTFDIDQASVRDTNDRTRIILNFRRFGWEHIGGSAWRYPALGSQNTSEDWFNHVVPALFYFRSLVQHAGLRVYNFTLDAHSEAGHRGNAIPPLGSPIHNATDIDMYPPNMSDPGHEDKLSETRLKDFLNAAANSL